jgi:hypothetical protein
MDKHLSLSFELIYLMGWLLKHEKGMLNSLIKHAIKNGLAQDLEKVAHETPGLGESSKELQSIILDFLSYLERSLAKNLDASHDLLAHADHKAEGSDIKLRLQRAKQLLSKELEATKQQENAADVVETEEVPVKKAKSKKSSKQSRQAVFDQILKTWKPNKGDLVN